MTSTNWNGAWTKTNNKICKEGGGFVVEGQIQKIRVHSVFVHLPAGAVVDQADCFPTRFNCLIIKVNNIHERAYDQYGDEIDYQSNKGKKGLKSYRELKTVSFDELANKIGDGGRAIPNDILDQANHLHPTTSSVFEFWVDSARSGAKELQVGDEVQVMTVKNSIFVDKFTVLNALPVSELESGWSKALHQHREGEVLVNKYVNLAHDSNVDDDEWDD